MACAVSRARATAIMTSTTNAFFIRNSSYYVQYKYSQTQPECKRTLNVHIFFYIFKICLTWLKEYLRKRIWVCWTGYQDIACRAYSCHQHTSNFYVLSSGSPVPTRQSEASANCSFLKQARGGRWFCSRFATMYFRFSLCRLGMLSNKRINLNRYTQRLSARQQLNPFMQMK